MQGRIGNGLNGRVGINHGLRDHGLAHGVHQRTDAAHGHADGLFNGIGRPSCVLARQGVSHGAGRNVLVFHQNLANLALVAALLHA